MTFSTGFFHHNEWFFLNRLNTRKKTKLGIWLCKYYKLDILFTESTEHIFGQHGGGWPTDCARQCSFRRCDLRHLNVAIRIGRHSIFQVIYVVQKNNVHGWQLNL